MARKPATLNVYNLAQLGVDVDTDNVHAPQGAFRTAQNLTRNPISSQAESVVSRYGLRNLNTDAIGLGAILGGITIPAFESGSGVPTLFLGFGD